MDDFRSVTIADVAREAGVSIRTVSRVLNDSPKVAKAARERIGETIARLEFRPSSRARALASGRSQLVGVVQDDPNSHVIGMFQRGIVDVCAARGYELVVHPAKFADPDLTRNIADFVRRSRVDGLIILPPVSEVPAIPLALSRLGVPSVAIASVRIANYPAVLISDERAATARMAEHFLELGHRRMAIVTGPMRFHSSTEREQGFRTALAAAGLPLPDRFVRKGGYDFTSGYQAGCELLDQVDRPTAIFACNDIMALGVMKAAVERGLVVPRDISIAGFDDSDIAAMVVPPLTTIRRPILDLAREAAERVIGMAAEKGEHRLADHRVDLPLVRRESTGAAPSAGDGPSRRG